MRTLRPKRAESGAIALEFAIVLPVVLVLFVGLAEFALAFREQIKLRNAAGAGAYFAITAPTQVRSSSDTDVCAPEGQGKSITDQAWEAYAAKDPDEEDEEDEEEIPADFVVSVKIDGTTFTGCDVDVAIDRNSEVEVSVTKPYQFAVIDDITPLGPSISITGTSYVRTLTPEVG